MRKKKKEQKNNKNKIKTENHTIITCRFNEKKKEEKIRNTMIKHFSTQNLIRKKKQVQLKKPLNKTPKKHRKLKTKEIQ